MKNNTIAESIQRNLGECLGKGIQEKREFAIKRSWHSTGSSERDDALFDLEQPDLGRHAGGMH